MQRLLKIDFVRFCLVGSTGFVINFALLTLLHDKWQVALPLAQFISAEIALFSNFLLHHNWTYKAHKVHKTVGRLVVEFHATSWVAVVGSTLLVSFASHVMHFNSLMALVFSSAIVLFWNFSWSKYVIWRKHAHDPETENSEIPS